MTEAKRVPGYTCAQCNWFDVFQVTSCPRCNRPVQETLFSGRGKVASFTVIRYPPTGFETERPDVAALVAIEAGPRVMGRIVAQPEEVQIGSSVSFLGNSTGKLEFTL